MTEMQPLGSFGILSIEDVKKHSGVTLTRKMEVHQGPRLHRCVCKFNKYSQVRGEVEVQSLQGSARMGTCITCSSSCCAWSWTTRKRRNSATLLQHDSVFFFPLGDLANFALLDGSVLLEQLSGGLFYLLNDALHKPWCSGPLRCRAHPLGSCTKGIT
jgi:hypothetical protein